MARASIKGIVCLPPEITTTSPGLTLTDVVTTRRASSPKSLSWGFAGTVQKSPIVKTLRGSIKRRKEIFLIVGTLLSVGNRAPSLAGLTLCLYCVCSGQVNAAWVQVQQIKKAKDLIAERVRAGMAHARAMGKRIGRPRAIVDVEAVSKLREGGQSLREIAVSLNIPVSLSQCAILPEHSKRVFRHCQELYADSFTYEPPDSYEV